MSALSEINRGRIIGMWECNISPDEISRRIPCSTQTVYSYIKRWQEGGEEACKDQRKNNRGQRLTTEEEDVALAIQVDENPFLSVSNSINLLNLNISERTGRRRLHELNIRCYRAAKGIKLSERHRQNRVTFAREQLNIAIEDWERTIWSDEKVFSSSEDKRLNVWRPQDCRFDEKYVIPTQKSGRITCGMWGWMSAHGPGELVEVSPHMNAHEYVEILEHVLLPSIRTIYPEEEMPRFRFVHDNSPIHTSNIVREWFAQHPEIEVLNWPARSPDLNIIENIWGIIVNSWDPGHERTREDVAVHAKTIWEGLRNKPELFENLNNSIRRRLTLVIEKEGFWTGY